jgi:hypothetical protein
MQEFSKRAPVSFLAGRWAKTTIFWDAMSIFSPLAGSAALAAAAIR